jgi:hypothetical protein
MRIGLSVIRRAPVEQEEERHTEAVQRTPVVDT